MNTTQLYLKPNEAKFLSMAVVSMMEQLRNSLPENWKTQVKKDLKEMTEAGSGLIVKLRKLGFNMEDLPQLAPGEEKDFLEPIEEQPSVPGLQYAPKLKKVMEEIKTIINRQDIAAFILLHSPGYTEYYNKVNPSYSCALIEGDQLRVRIKQSELPGGKEQAQKLAEGTYNMITLMTDMLVQHAHGYLQLQESLKDKWGGEEGPGNQSSHSQQNN